MEVLTGRGYGRGPLLCAEVMGVGVSGLGIQSLLLGLLASSRDAMLSHDVMICVHGPRCSLWCARAATTQRPPVPAHRPYLPAFRKLQRVDPGPGHTVAPDFAAAPAPERQSRLGMVPWFFQIPHPTPFSLPSLPTRAVLCGDWSLPLV
jgi:hypothetical protein